MLDAPGLARDFAGLRHGLSAGEALPAPVRLAWSAATGKPIYEALGMSEVSTYLSFSPARPTVEGAAGFPQPGRRVAVLADDGPEPVPRGTEGLLAVSRRDPGLMLGYWNRPRGDRGRLPRRMVRHRRPRGDARRRRHRLARPRRRPHERRRLPRQPGRDRGGAARASRRRRGGRGRGQRPPRRLDRRRLLRPATARRRRRPISPPIAPRASRATNARGASTRSRRCRATPTASCSAAG